MEVQMPSACNNTELDSLSFIKLLQDLDARFNNVDKYNFNKKLHDGYQDLSIGQAAQRLSDDKTDLSKLYFKITFLQLQREIKLTSDSLAHGVNASRLRELFLNISTFVNKFKSSYPLQYILHVPAALCSLRQRSFRLMFRYEIINYFEKNHQQIEAIINSDFSGKVVFKPKPSEINSFAIQQSGTSNIENQSLLGNKVSRGKLFNFGISVFSNKHLSGKTACFEYDSRKEYSTLK